MTPTFFLSVLSLLTSFQCGALSLKSIRTWKAESRFPVRAYALSQRQILNLNADCGDVVTLETSVHRYVRDKVEGSTGGEAASQDPVGPKVESKRCTEAIVDLFGVLHVADSSYYKELNGILAQYDVILYELITSNSNVDLIFGEDDHSLKSDLETAAKQPVRKKKQVSTKHKYLGAAMSYTGDIYGVPSHARKLLRISASGGRLSLPSLVDSTTGEAINMNRKFKWLRGQVYRDSVYCIPAWADCVLKLSPSEEEEDTIQATELGKVEIGKAVQDLREAGHDARWLYHGAAEGRDECIYAIPCNAEFVLKIDPRTDKVSLVGATASAQFGKLFGVNNEARLPVGGNKWYGGIRGVDGCVYGMPYCTRDGVLKVTPPQSYSTDEEATVSVIPIHSPVVTSPRTMSPVGGKGDEEGKLCRWHGGILNPEDGYIYAIPSHSQHVLRIDTNLPGPGQLAGNTSGGGVVELLGGEDHIPPGSYKWGGGAVGSDGRVYGIPSDSDKVLVVDPSPPPTAQTGAEGAEVRLLDIPSYADEVTDQKGGELPRINKWQGGLRVDRAIYCFPCNAVSVLKITTPERGSTEAAVVEEIGVGVIPRGRCKWQGGNYNEREHCIYCVPEHGDSVLRIDCADDSVTLLPLPSDEGEGGEEGRREVSRPFSRPRRRLNTEIQSPTADALATKYGLRTQLDLPMNADSRYFVADLDRETVAKMESDDGRRQRLRESYQVSQSEGLLGGSSARDLLFDRSTSAAATASRAQFRVDGPFLAAARLASWLTPAPEVTQLLLDWSRSRARATTGGLTLSSLNAACKFLLASFSPSTFFLPSREGLARARQILFAQQLVSGVADDGWFGGSALSDVGVRVEERNKAAVEVLQGVLADEDKPRVAVLYGVYHLKDLSRRLEDLGLRPVSGAEAEGGSFEKKAPVLPPDNSLVAWRMAIPGGAAAAGGEEAVPVRRYAAALVVGSLYLVVSTLDWFVLLRLVIKAVEALPLLPSIASFSLANDALPVPVPTVSLDGVTDDQVVDFSLGVLYLSLYIRRHRDILVSFTTGIVDWNKGLYDEE